ncbi:MAG: hypothetical protein QW057_09375 [Candidatus Bathyarchaeia archaeon]
MEDGLLTTLQGLKHVRLIDPLSYHESLRLMQEASAVLTDSGGCRRKPSGWQRPVSRYDILQNGLKPSLWAQTPWWEMMRLR